MTMETTRQNLEDCIRVTETDIAVKEAELSVLRGGLDQLTFLRDSWDNEEEPSA